MKNNDSAMPAADAGYPAPAGRKPSPRRRRQAGRPPILNAVGNDSVSAFGDSATPEPAADGNRFPPPADAPMEASAAPALEFDGDAARMEEPAPPPADAPMEASAASAPEFDGDAVRMEEPAPAPVAAPMEASAAPALEFDGDAARMEEPAPPPAAAPMEEIDDAGEECRPEDSLLPFEGVVEAVLMAAPEALSARRIAQCTGRDAKEKMVRGAVDELNRKYQESGRSFEIAEVEGKFRILTRPEYAVPLRRLFPAAPAAEKDKPKALAPAARDTLAIIVYKQPVTRAEIQAVRGVDCGPALRTLVERGLVRVVGKKQDAVGQPLVYGTTGQFLREYGLASLDEVPDLHDWRLYAGIDAALPDAEAPPAADIPAARGSEPTAEDISAGDRPAAEADAPVEAT